MKAIVLQDFGGVDQLVQRNIETPVIGDGEVLVKVKAISINPVDVKTRAGKGVAGRLKGIQPVILGWDIAGVVEASKTALFKETDEVFGMVNFPGHGKAYAEYVAVPADQLAMKPANISFEEAAAATLAPLTVWQAMVRHARVREGDKVLIHAAAGGVGHYAVQVAKHLGAYVIGTASAANREFVLGLGADEFIDYRTVAFEKVVHDIDFVLDTLGGDNIDRSLEVIRSGGTLISIPSGLNEQVAEKAKARGIDGRFILVQSNGEDMRQLAGLLERGVVRSHVSQVFDINEMGQAHLQIESGRTRGKVVVRGF